MCGDRCRGIIAYSYGGVLCVTCTHCVYVVRVLHKVGNNAPQTNFAVQHHIIVEAERKLKEQ